MDKFDFYKEQYYKELDRKNEINNSLNTHIGLMTAFAATSFYLLTSYDYSKVNICFYTFLLIAFFAVILQLISAYHLIKALSNFHNGYSYAYLNDTDDLEKYRNNLKLYYTSINSEDLSEKEFDYYLESELIKSTGINQKNNKLKTLHRFLCNKFLMYSFITLFVLVLPFAFNKTFTKGDYKILVKLELDSMNYNNLYSVQGKIFKDSVVIKSLQMLNDNKGKIEKPEPPPTQIIKEGEIPVKTK